MTNCKPGIALVDDHALLRSGLAGMIRSFRQYDVLFEACGGLDLIRQLQHARRPDLVLLDISMPEMDGCETASWLRLHHPEIRILALSMYDAESAIVRMLRNGAKGYILKDSVPEEWRLALESVIHKGFYAGHPCRPLLVLNERELEFMRLVCTEWTYKEIADRMYLSPRTIDGYRDALFEKLNVRTRVGLAMFAVKSGIVNIDPITTTVLWQEKEAPGKPRPVSRLAAR
ncbi:MAG TPA: response regulator transcription factor [Puia sp.]|nr:response regulator transcription factor [Puia sp.]